MTRKTNKLLQNSYELPNNVIDTVPTPIVTVRTITYNHAPYIRECIESILMQKTNFPFEYIIGEDFSSDGTREIVFEYAKRFPDKIRVITADQNFGMMANVRRCALAARGKYIALCEGDDYWTDPYKLQKQVDVLEQNPDVVITYHDSVVIDSIGNIIAKSKLPINRRENFSKDELKTGIWILTQTMCFRNLVKEYPKGFFKVLNGDTFLISFLGNYGRGLFIENINPSYYRINESGVWSMKTNIERKLKSLSTTIELLKFYKTKNDKKFIDYFTQRTKKTILSLLECKLTFKQKKYSIAIVFSIIRYLKIKDSLFYLRMIILN
jgi:glycosyltransferase involved in cell wall biosynthesis